MQRGGVEYTDASGRWPEWEREVAAADTILPLVHRHAWAAAQPANSLLLLPVYDDTRKLITVVAVQRDLSRVLPGHAFLRVQRFGHGWPAETWAPAIEALAALAKRDRRVLRLSMEVFLRDGHDTMREVLRRNGFQPAPPRSYRHTLTMDLRPTEEEILTPLKSLRKRLKEVEKINAAVVPLEDGRYAERLTSLQRQAMQRSGGSFRVADWPRLLQLSAQHPELSRIVGLFPSAEETAPEQMYGFAWGCMHGDHAEYRAAGTAELSGTIHRLPVSYPLLWNLVRWAKTNGSSWMDLGGVTVQEGGDDQLAGISAFKSTFSHTLEEVGEEWMLEPHPLRSGLARGLSSLVAKMPSMRKPAKAATT